MNDCYAAGLAYNLDIIIAISKRMLCCDYCQICIAVDQIKNILLLPLVIFSSYNYV